MFATDPTDKIRAITFNIKDALAQLDSSALAATIALAGFGRVGLFLLNGVLADESNKDLQSLIGWPVKATVVKDQMAERGFTWDFDASLVEDEATARAWIIASLATLKGEES